MLFAPPFRIILSAKRCGLFSNINSEMDSLLDGELFLQRTPVIVPAIKFRSRRLTHLL